MSKAKNVVMNRKNTLVASLALALSLALLTSCGGEDPIVEAGVLDVVEEVAHEGNETYYQIPSPDEMVGFIKESGLAFNGELLSSIKNVDSYVDPKSQALNFLHS